MHPVEAKLFNVFQRQAFAYYVQAVQAVFHNNYVPQQISRLQQPTALRGHLCLKSDLLNGEIQMNYEIKISAGKGVTSQEIKTGHEKSGFRLSASRMQSRPTND